MHARMNVHRRANLRADDEESRPRVDRCGRCGMLFSGRRCPVCRSSNLFDPEVLLELLVRCERLGGTDFGAHILPGLPLRHRSFAYDFSTNWVPGVRPWEERCYWRDVGTLEAYRAALRDVTGAWPRFELDNALWPIRGERRSRNPAAEPAWIETALMAGTRADHPARSPSRDEGAASWR